MKKQYYPLLSSIAIAVCILATPFCTSAQVHVKKAKSSLNCNQPPILHCPPNLDACPGSSIDPNITEHATAFPGGPECGIPIVSHIDNIIKTGNCSGSQLVQRIWTAQDPDDSNLRAFCIQYLSTLDTTGPVFSNCPRDTSILTNSNCVANYSWKMPWVSDVCGNFSVSSSHTNGSEFSVGIHHIVFTATDACGNSSTCGFRLEVISNCCIAPPKITCPPDFFSCPSAGTDTSVTGKPVVEKATAFCNEPILSYSDKVTEVSSCKLQIERKWTAQDPLNPQLNVSCVQKIILQDTTPPVFTFCPPNVTVQSGPDCTAIVNWQTPTAVDDCGPVSISSSVPSGWLFHLGYSLITVTATDICGNTSKCEFLIFIEDHCCQKPPVIQCPADYIGCPGSILEPAITGHASATPGDINCNTPVLQFTDHYVNSNDCATEIERTWKATDPDNHSLFSTCIQKITLKDTIPPQFTFCPPNITVQSGPDCTAIVNWQEPTAVDNCGPVQITSSVPSGWLFHLGYSLITVIATDRCGNTSKCEFLIFIEDNCCNKAPVIQCPADYTGCPGSSIEPSVTGHATATPGNPNCNAPVLSFSDHTLSSSDCTTEIERTWKATDPNNNLFTTCVQKIKLEDKTAPVITFCPPDVTVQSGSDCTAIFFWNQPEASDNCTTVHVSTSIPNGSVFQIGQTTVTVTATDACGNSSTCQFTITVTENCCKNPPIITCPADFTGCPSSDLEPSTTGTATALPGDPHCSQPVITYNDVPVKYINCYLEVNRTWTATDPSNLNLKSTCVQKLYLKDETAPVITFCPPDITVQSDDDCTASVNWNQPEATDNCGATTIFTSKPSGFRFQIGTSPVFVIATDACGNQSACQFFVTVTENCCNGAPVIECPADYHGCPGSSTDIFVTGKATVDPLKPICVQPFLTFSDSTVSTDPCRTVINRIWKAVNPKSNASSTCIQTIILEDVDSPVFASCPHDVTVDPQYNCNAVVNWDFPVANDNCGLKNILATHQSGETFTKGVTRVVFTASDNCGNTSTCWFFITVTDNCCDQNPVIHCPSDYTSCPGPGINPAVTGTATADPGKPTCLAPVISYTDSIISNGPCPGAIKLIRKWIAVDPNISTLRAECKQLIDIKDTAPPQIRNMPSDLTVNAKGACDVPMFWNKPEAFDNCGISSFTSNFKSGARFSAGISTIIYTAVDLCGLVTTDSFHINVSGTEIGINCPDDTTVIRLDPFVNGVFVDWNTPQVKHCTSCKTSLPGFIYMGDLDGHSYFCSTGPAKWGTAKFICEQLGGKLAVINSLKENKFLASKLMGLTAWVGGTDERTEGHFEWIDNSPFSFTSWSPGQPNNGDGLDDYIELLPDGTWNDQNGNLLREYICEITCYDLTQTGGTPQGELLPCGKNKITYVAQKDGKSDTCSFNITVDCDKESIYCKAKGLDSKYMFINRVEFAGIDTITGDNGGYHYFNKACGTILPNKTYPICVTPGFLSTTYKVYWKIWIDFNADGFFDPVTEEVVYGFGTTTMCANLTMPQFLPSKQTRMRVIMSYSGYPVSPCSSPLFGEVEDYCILMNGATANLPENEIKPVHFNSVQLHCAANCAENEKSVGEINSNLFQNARQKEKSPFEVDLFPNPSSNEVNVVSPKDELGDYEIYDHHGKMVQRSVERKKGNAFSFSVGEWPNGIYTILLYNNTGEQLIKRFMVNH